MSVQRYQCPECARVILPDEQVIQGTQRVNATTWDDDVPVDLDGRTVIVDPGCWPPPGGGWHVIGRGPLRKFRPAAT